MKEERVRIILEPDTSQMADALGGMGGGGSPGGGGAAGAGGSGSRPYPGHGPRGAPVSAKPEDKSNEDSNKKQQNEHKRAMDAWMSTLKGLIQTAIPGFSAIKGAANFFKTAAGVGAIPSLGAVGGGVGAGAGAGLMAGALKFATNPVTLFAAATLAAAVAAKKVTESLEAFNPQIAAFAAQTQMREILLKRQEANTAAPIMRGSLDITRSFQDLAAAITSSPVIKDIAKAVGGALTLLSYIPEGLARLISGFNAIYDVLTFQFSDAKKQLNDMLHGTMAGSEEMFGAFLKKGMDLKDAHDIFAVVRMIRGDKLPWGNLQGMDQQFTPYLGSDPKNNWYNIDPASAFGSDLNKHFNNAGKVAPNKAYDPNDAHMKGIQNKNDSTTKGGDKGDKSKDKPTHSVPLPGPPDLNAVVNQDIRINLQHEQQVVDSMNQIRDRLLNAFDTAMQETQLLVAQSTSSLAADFM